MSQFFFLKDFMTHWSNYSGKDGKNQCWQACRAIRTHTNCRTEWCSSDFRKLFDRISWNQTFEPTIHLLNILNRILDMSSSMKIYSGVCGSSIYVSPIWAEDKYVSVPKCMSCWHPESFKLKEISMAQKQDSSNCPPVSGSLHSRWRNLTRRWRGLSEYCLF